MIDAENEIFSAVASTIRGKHNGAYVVGEYVKAPPKFPCISIVETDNQAYQNTEDSGNVENHAMLMYEVNIYSNKTSGKKSECRAIATTIDEKMSALGFARTMLQPVPNLDDATIYRIVGRYSAVISRNKTIYRR